jgi:hypothetical protein
LAAGGGDATGVGAVTITERERTILQYLVRHNGLSEIGGAYYLLGGHGHIPVRYHAFTLGNMARRGLLTSERGYYQVTDVGRAIAATERENEHG